MTLRTKITALTALLIFIATALLGVIAFWTTRTIQYDSLDRGLIAAARDARTKSLQVNPRPLPTDVYLPYAISLIRPGYTETELLRPAGYGSDPLPFPVLTREQALSLLDTPTSVAFTPEYRLVTVVSGPNRALVVAGTPIDELKQGLTRLTILLGIGVLIVTVLGSLIAWLFVRRLFRPVDEMVVAAEEIAQGNTHLRVPEAPEGTELGVLSDALNTMIESLTASLTAVEASELRLRGFVSDASHEIRTPLTVIRGYVELLQAQRDQASELEIRALDRIESESRRLENLVTQLLLLERIDSGSQAAREEFDLSALIREHFGDLTDLGEGRPVTMNLATAQLDGSADQWRQVLANIVQNITRYTPEGSTVHVDLTATPSQLTLTIDDSGPGIPADKRGSVTERFTRLDESRSSTTGGFGLGMSIIAAVVDTHHGVMTLAKSPTGGLRIVITVPITASTSG
jgi:two-component system OmpR family sensor kinase